MTDTDTDTEYDLGRAEQEAVLAIQADNPEAADAHRRLSNRYAARAVISIVNGQDEPKARVRRRGLIATIRAGQSIPE
jgi:hypothetical protein